MRRIAVVAAVLGAGGVIAGCGGSTTTSDHSKATASSGAASAKTFLIIGENTSASQITAAHAPYLVDTLKPRAAWLTSYHSFTNSSSLGTTSR